MTPLRPTPGAAVARHARHPWAAALLSAGVLALAGCGGDDSETTTGTTSTTENTPTGETTTSTTTSGETTTTSTATTGGSGSGSGGSGAYDPEQDTEDNDLKPPAGSAAEELERNCRKNPGACS
ncbi:MAG: hypothetical protein ACR2G3_07025 [Solirubrobacterales bacterium]